MVLAGARVEHLFAERLELGRRPGLVLAPHPAVADHIGNQDRRKSPLDPRLGHRVPVSSQNITVSWRRSASAG